MPRGQHSDKYRADGEQPTRILDWTARLSPRISIQPPSCSLPPEEDIFAASDQMCRMSGMDVKSFSRPKYSLEPQFSTL